MYASSRRLGRRERSCSKTLQVLQAAGIKIPRYPLGKGMIGGMNAPLSG